MPHPPTSELKTALEIVQGVLADTESVCELVRVSDLEFMCPPSGYDQVTASAFLRGATVLTDEMLEQMEDAGWALCVHLPNGAVTRVHPKARLTKVS